MHGVELDLKWARDGDDLLLYAYHGPTGRQVLSARRARARAAWGELVLLEGVLALGELPLLVELKCGRGSVEQALERLVALCDEHGARERVWLAASSLTLLRAAREVAPDLPRVLFAPRLLSGQRVLHLPKTSIVRSLLRDGVASRPEGVDLLCPIGLRPASAAAHLARAARARERGLDYLPGRVAGREVLAALAAGGLPGAFVYAAPSSW